MTCLLQTTKFSSEKSNAIFYEEVDQSHQYICKDSASQTNATPQVIKLPK